VHLAIGEKEVEVTAFGLHEVSEKGIEVFRLSMSGNNFPQEGVMQ